jgi:hypothetical protein
MNNTPPKKKRIACAIAGERSAPELVENALDELKDHGAIDDVPCKY